METADADEIIVPLCIIIICAGLHQLQQQARRRFWVRPWITRRREFGAYHSLIRELSDEDEKGYKNFLRMDMDSFNELLHLVEPHIKRQDSLMRQSISPAERLALTLRFLATGETYQSLEYLYRIPKSTIRLIIPETCDVIYRVLKDTYLKVPDTAAAWQRIADEIEEKWDFPNCIGAIDGKHVVLRNPPGSGSTYFNYKGHFSIVLLAIVDADYNFVYVDVGRNGRTNDAGVFSRSPITELLENRQLNIPQPKPLPGRRTDIPYVLVGDDAFPLKDYLMKPYPNRQLDNEKRIFNYRLSRARRIVENVFGIMSSRFGVFQKALPLDPEIVTSVVLSACVLHNFLRSKSSSRQVYSPDGTFDKDNTPGEWRANVGPSNMENFVQQGGNRNRSDARGVRDEFCDYFNSNGQVPWQWDVIHIPDW